MTERTPTETTNLDRYGHAALPWDRARDAMADDPPEAMTTWFVGSVRPGGVPHSAGVGALWHEDAVYFTSGPDSRKARNLAANPGCTISVKLRGIDVVLEGRASRISDGPTLHAIATRYRDGGWPVEVDGDAFTAPYSAPSAGPPPWHLYRVEIQTGFGVATEEPHGATRWRFER